MGATKGSDTSAASTDAQRWRIVAGWFDEAARTGEFGQRTQSGLCWALDHADPVHSSGFGPYDTPAHRVVRAVMGEIYDHHDYDYGTREGAGWRACLALLLAHDAEDSGGNHAEDA